MPCEVGRTIWGLWPESLHSMKNVQPFAARAPGHIKAAHDHERTDSVRRLESETEVRRGRRTNLRIMGIQDETPRGGGDVPGTPRSRHSSLADSSHPQDRFPRRRACCRRRLLHSPQPQLIARDSPPGSTLLVDSQLPSTVVSARPSLPRHVSRLSATLPATLLVRLDPRMYADICGRRELRAEETVDLARPRPLGRYFVETCSRLETLRG